MPKLPDSFLARPIAHRGLHDLKNGVQENSRASFIAAIKGGYGIELDLQMSADGEAMVFHDYHLGELTGKNGALQMRTAEELRQIPLNVGDETIPDLSEILHLVNGQAPMLIELKDQDGALGPNIGKLEARVAEILSHYKGDAVVMSFNPYSMLAMAKLAPNLPRGITTCDYNAEHWQWTPRKRAEELREIPDFDRTGACFISHNYTQLNAAPVQALKARDVPILSWTICNSEQETIARNGADNITFEGYRP